MQLLRSKFAGIFVVVIIVIGCCDCKGISQKDIHFVRIPNQRSTFVESLAISLKEARNFWARKEGQQTIKEFGQIAADLTGAKEFLAAVPVLQLVSSQGSDWKSAVSNLIPDQVIQKIVETDIEEILNKIDTLQNSLEILKSNITDKKKLPIADNIDTTLLGIIGRFRDGGSPFRKYPALVAPILISLASFVPDFYPIMAKLDSSLAQASNVSCNLAETITDYFPPTLLERFVQITVDAKIPRETFPKQALFKEGAIKIPFNPEGYKINQDVRCEQVPKEEENQTKKNFLIIRDRLNENNSYKDNIDGDCVYDYYSLVRYRLETLFGDAFKLANATCINNKAEQITGNGWLSIEIGALQGRMPGNKSCDFAPGLDAQYCDPYVQISIDDKNVYKTKPKKDVKRWTTYDETFYSDRISKNTEVTIKIFDENLHKHTLMFNETKSVTDLLTTTRIGGTDVTLFLYPIWTDEYAF